MLNSLNYVSGAQEKKRNVYVLIDPLTLTQRCVLL